MKLLESYYNEITTRQNAVARSIIESRSALESINNLSQDKSLEVLVPLGSGILTHAQVPPTDKFIVSIGADLAIEKTRTDTSFFIDERIKEMEKAMSMLNAQKLELGNKINSIKLEINKLLEQLKSG